jgi:pyrroloquinoline quinone biosynthesis protein B
MSDNASTGPFVVTLGIAQDGGFPQAGCDRECCREAWDAPDRQRGACCLGVVDPPSGSAWMIDATPGFPRQLRALLALGTEDAPLRLQGILLSHGHVGHYAGLLHLSREVMGAHQVRVFGLPRMRDFLVHNGPWNNLVRLGNISLEALETGRALLLGGAAAVPFTVPHRDEYTETAGFRISGPRASIVYIPDVDSWEAMEAKGVRIEDEIAKADTVLVDGTFFDDREIAPRYFRELSHPFVARSLERFAALAPEERAKVRFIHLNHSNPALRTGSPERKRIEESGCRVAEEGERIAL